MQADEIAEAVLKLKSRAKLLILTLILLHRKQNPSKNEGFAPTTISATHFEPMVDGSFDYMQVNSIRPMSWNPLFGF
jgi:predicted oxidoreductase